MDFGFSCSSLRNSLYIYDYLPAEDVKAHAIIHRLASVRGYQPCIHNRNLKPNLLKQSPQAVSPGYIYPRIELRHVFTRFRFPPGSCPSPSGLFLFRSPSSSLKKLGPLPITGVWKFSGLGSRLLSPPWRPKPHSG